MNWSHALLVVSLICGFPLVFIAITYIFRVDAATKFHRNWMIVQFIITVISGALAAGLWR